MQKRAKEIQRYEVQKRMSHAEAAKQDMTVNLHSFTSNTDSVRDVSK